MVDNNSLNLLFLNISLHLNETCDPDSVTSIVKHHIPDAKLTAQSEDKLTYILPLERTNKFPGNRMQETTEMFVIMLCTITVVFRMMIDILLLSKYLALWIIYDLFFTISIALMSTLKQENANYISSYNMCGQEIQSDNEKH